MPLTLKGSEIYSSELKKT